MLLPKKIEKVVNPPVIIQGTKKKLVPLIAESITWDGKGTYYEPFMGSGVVGFNLEPERAVFSDVNPHLIRLYKDIQEEKITPDMLRSYLTIEGEKLKNTPKDKNSYYYVVRNRFNEEPNSLDFLFLSRTNFNGLMRFNKKGGYNSPFCRKPDKISDSLIEVMVKELKETQDIIVSKDWQFIEQPFEKSFALAGKGDFIYLDPPYVGREVRYFKSWNDDLSDKLVKLAKETKAGYAFSMWYSDGDVVNPYMEEWKDGKLIKIDHSYIIGGKKDRKMNVVEALVVKEG